MFLLGSPMCTRFCSWQALNDTRYEHDPEEVRRERARAMIHLEFVCELYIEQVNARRYFLHEHPAGATSWSEDCISHVLQCKGVDLVTGDRCQYGQEDDKREPVKKPTKWLSNSQEVLKQLSRRCNGREGRRSRRAGAVHSVVQGSTTKRTAIYTPELCRAILRGFRNQLVMDGRLILGTVGIQRPEEKMSDKELLHVAGYYGRTTYGCCNVESETGETFHDAITGQPLRPDLVRAARREELEYFASKHVWKKVPWHRARELQGKPAISVRWIDANKGDVEHPNYRSRLAREVRNAWESTIFAPTPPLEALRSVLSFAATDAPGRKPHVRDPR